MRFFISIFNLHSYARPSMPENCCSICLEGISRDEAEATPCAHVFHRECLSTWKIRSISCISCPICKTNLSPLSDPNPPWTAQTIEDQVQELLAVTARVRQESSELTARVRQETFLTNQFLSKVQRIETKMNYEFPPPFNTRIQKVRKPKSQRSSQTRQCSGLIKSGKNKGQRCPHQGRKKNGRRYYCQRHNPSKIV